MNEKYEKYYKYTTLAITSITLYLFIILFKNLFLEMFNLNINNLTKNENILINIIYQIFALTITIYFFINKKNETLEKLKKYIKNSLIGISTILIYNLTTTFEIGLLYYNKVNVSAMSITAKTIYLISCEIIIMASIALINKKDIQKKINPKEYEKYFKYYFLALVIMMISNILINIISPGIAGNEQSVRNIFAKAPIYMFFSAVIFAPFCEEMVFRLSIKKIINNNKIFIITSGLLFGLLHVIGNINNLTDILYIIPYSVPGFVFAYMYSKTNNIYVPMGFHFFHNLILMLIQIITLFI